MKARASSSRRASGGSAASQKRARRASQDRFQPFDAVSIAPDSGTTGEFEAAVVWMREELDRLVSTLYPKLQRMIAVRS